MSNSASRARLESINRVALGTRSDDRFQAVLIRDIDMRREEVAEILRDADIFEDTNRRPRVEFDHDVDVATALRLAAGNRAEKSRMPNTAPPQLCLVRLQRGDDPFPNRPIVTPNSMS